jgi:TrmH family RNA methyltransferase
MLRISSRNARFQQWEALLGNRAKRQRAGEFLVHGVRPITLAAEYGWRFRALLYDAERPLSAWARSLLRDVPALQVAMAPGLLAELGEKAEGPPELIAVVEMPDDDLHRIAADPKGPSFLGVLLDRPASPGNVGSIIRSADAFGADGVVVTGHAADVYDPRAVRASTGSLFARPVVRCPSHREVMAWVRAQPDPITVAAADEHGEVNVFDHDFTEPTLLLVGNETAGLAAAWRDLCDVTVRIPITGAASSLNAANAATAILYEITRQRLGVQHLRT